MKTILILLTNIFLFTQLISADIIKIGSSEQNLDQRWSAAIEHARNNNLSNYFIIYTFEKMMPENSFIGHFNDDWQSRKKLGELLYPDMPVNYINSITGTNRQDSDRKIVKELAIIFEMKKPELADLDMSTIDAYYELKDKPVLWLGKVKETESLQKIKSVFGQTKSHDIKESAITAAAMHKNDPESYMFLKDIIDNNESSELREDAVFWIAQQDNPEAIDYLKNLAKNDRDEEVAEKAVFALYNIKSEKATDAVIDLAKTAKNKKVREKAIFWLGQLAGKKALETLTDIVFDEEKTELQEKAVFALSQLDNGEGIPKLIKAAKEHPNPQIRKKAIFWLGESGDQRALEALIEMVQK